MSSAPNMKNRATNQTSTINCIAEEVTPTTDEVPTVSTYTP